MGKPKGQSRGLAYLRQVRPEAMTHLLKFFSESGRHLEPKTRFLISVVTKVINFSPRGLEQYARRALAEGASADEILDAILCSYPCAGLTRVVDAVDVLLDMDLKEFEAPRFPQEVSGSSGSDVVAEAAQAVALQEKQWVDVAAEEELLASDRLRVTTDGYDVVIFRADGRLFACDNRCPHAGGPLAGGHLHGHVVSCPLHSWQFDLESGDCVDVPGKTVPTYDVRVEAGRVYLDLPS